MPIILRSVVCSIKDPVAVKSITHTPIGNTNVLTMKFPSEETFVLLKARQTTHHLCGK
jgi:hypothetical protein